MATLTLRLASVENDGCWVEADYNDQNNQALLARWQNTLNRPVRGFVILPSGKVVFDGTIAAAGAVPAAGQIAASGTFDLQGADRFNVVTQSPTVNLAAWATPTSP